MKSGSALIVAALATLSESRGAKHPFVGENANSSGVHRDDGTLSMRLGAKPGNYGKLDNFVSGEGLFETDLGYLGPYYETLFGEYKSEFSKKVDEHLAAKESKTSKRKLGQASSFPAVLDNETGYIWTGEMYMGQLSKLDVVYDTASDWLVVEGLDCDSCEGNRYDIAPSLEAGTAL